MEEIWTIRRIMTWSTDFLSTRSIDKDATAHRLEVEILLSHSLSVQRIELFMNLDKPLLDHERKIFKENLNRRLKGEPVAHITGVRDFYGYKFQVTQHTLIPRPDTELLVESTLDIAKDLKKQGREKLRILDIGTGTGCIAISLFKKLQSLGLEVYVEAWDISEAALECAKKNAEDLLAAQIVFKLQDVLTYDDLSDSFDIVVSNPPYLTFDEYQNQISLSVKNFEPKVALVGGDTGLKFYEFYSKRNQLPMNRLLSKGSYLCLEIGSLQAESISSLFINENWKLLSVLKDLSGLNRGLVLKY